MTAEQTFFIEVLSDFINQRKTDPPDGLNWAELSRLAHIHQVEGILYHQCKGFIPEENKAAFQQAYGAALFFYMNRKHEYNIIAKELEAADVFFFPVKGFLVSPYYPIPELRTMGDCDIIIHRVDMPKVQSLMREVGYQGIDNIYANSWECRKKEFLFEFHDQLVSGDEHASDEQRSFFNGFDAYVTNHELERSFHFLFLLMHLRKHFMNSGVGIRPFIDLAVMIKSESGLDWEWLQEKLQETGLMPFARACFFLINHWFGITAQIATSDMENDAFEQITQKVLGNGIFGENDSENHGNFEKNALIKAKGNIWVRRIALITKLIFPPYRFMKSYPRCGFLNGKPVLLPVAWARRIRMLFHGKNIRKIGRLIRNSSVSFESIERQKDLLKKMGLV